MPARGLTAEQRKEFVDRQAKLIRERLDKAGKGKDAIAVRQLIIDGLAANGTKEKIVAVCDELNKPENMISTHCMDTETVGRLCTVRVEDKTKSYATQVRQDVLSRLEPITLDPKYRDELQYDKLYHTLMDVKDDQGNIKEPLKRAVIAPNA